MNDKRLEGLLYECGAIPIAAVCEKLMPFPVTKLCKVGTAKTIPIAAKPKKPKLWFIPREAAEELGVCLSTLYKLIKLKKLKATNIGTRGEKKQYRIYINDIIKYKDTAC